MLRRPDQDRRRILRHQLNAPDFIPLQHDVEMRLQHDLLHRLDAKHLISLGQRDGDHHDDLVLQQHA